MRCPTCHPKSRKKERVSRSNKAIPNAMNPLNPHFQNMPKVRRAMTEVVVSSVITMPTTSTGPNGSGKKLVTRWETRAAVGPVGLSPRMLYKKSCSGGTEVTIISIIFPSRRCWIATSKMHTAMAAGWNMLGTYRPLKALSLTVFTHTMDINGAP